MPVAYAGIAASVIGAVGSAVGGSGASDAISAGQGQANAQAQAAIGEGRANYTQDRATYQPFVNAGSAGTNQFANIMGVNGQDAANTAMGQFQASPGYQYQVNQGLRTVDNGAASNGMLYSGATLKAEQTLGSNLANQDFGNYMGRLNSLSQIGLAGANGQATSTSDFNRLLSGQSSNIQSTDTSAAGQQASIYGNTANKIGSAAEGGLGQAKQNGLLNFGGGNPTTAGVAVGGVEPLTGLAGGFGGI